MSWRRATESSAFVDGYSSGWQKISNKLFIETHFYSRFGIRQTLQIEVMKVVGGGVAFFFSFSNPSLSLVNSRHLKK